MALNYAGALLPAEAHELMQAGAKLVDVRTKPELLYVGKVPGSVAVEWQTYPGSRENPEFLGELAAAVPKETPVMFLCRSGARSNAAAEAATQRRLERGLQHPRGLRGRQGRGPAPQFSRRLAQGRPALDPKLNSGSGSQLGFRVRGNELRP